jgi:ATP-dependent exoDNAse (exonuclease V) beta subunit
VSGNRKPLVDQAARGRATADLGTSFCVEAGAGTGKTTLLVERFLAIVESGKAACDEIVAITFTEKAAGEMKVRLREKILKRSREAAVSASARAKLDTAYNELERSPISTIHAFAATILREHPIEAGVDPNFTQLDALESELFFDECWNDFLAEGAEEWGETLRRFMMFGGSIGSLRDTVDTMYERRSERSCGHMFDPGARLGTGSGADSGAGSCTVSDAGSRAGGTAPGAVPDGFAALRDTFTAAAARLSALARDSCVNPDDLGRAAIAGFVEGMNALRFLEGEDLAYYLLTLRLPKGKGNKGNWRPAEACTEQKEIFKSLAAAQELWRTRVSDDLARRIEEFAGRFLAFVEARKVAAGVLDFDDLLIKVRELCNNPEALDALRTRYRYILVDEFQDTDPVQAEIVYLLAGAPGVRGKPESTPGTPEPAPGKLFIVGDPKQSIYRFRKADIEMYERVKERLSESGERLSITQNFRSVPGIVEWVNDTFSVSMQPGSSGFQPRYEAIHAARPGEGSAVALLDLELDEEHSKAGAVREREGEAIARLIHWLKDGGMTVMDTNENKQRSIEYGDIAVIYPGTTGIDNYEEPLRAGNIPYIIEGGKLYYTREEIRDLASAIWAIEDPYDPLALVAALRSPMFGSSDEELFLFVKNDGRLCYLDPGAAAAAKPDALAAAFEVLAELHRGRNERGPSGTVLELLRRTKYLELCSLRPHGEQRVSNIRKAVSSARAFEGRPSSYRRFARWFRDQEALASAEGESPIVEEQENAVRLLTVHKAKGLQFPVVILANLVQSRRYSSRILVDRGVHVSFKLGLLETSDHAELAEAEKERDAAETVRLLYVAATRAGDRLVIPRVPGGGTYFDLIEGCLDSEHVAPMSLSDLPPLRGASRPIVGFREPSSAEKKRSAAERAAWLAARERLIERATRAPLVLAPSRMAEEAAAPVAGRGQDRPARERLLLFGQAFHRIMELAELSRPRLPAGLARSVASGLGIEDEAAELERIVATVLGSDLIKRAARSVRSYREVPFTLPWEGDFIEGRIDLLFEDDGAWTLVDYKTDDVAPSGLEERVAVYEPQAAVYALALERLGMKCSGGIVLYFARPNVARTIEPSAALAARAEGLIREGVIALRGS